jgi:hypothetical protein
MISPASRLRKPVRSGDGILLSGERKIFSEVMKAVRPGRLLVYKTHTLAQVNRAE